MTQQSWMDRLQSQKFISEEQLLVLGNVQKSPEASTHSASRILNVMDQMLKIGASEN